MLVEYSSNNSGGEWWLTDEDWKKLEAAGWKVRWLADRPDPFGREYPDGRFMGALAMYAIKDFPGYSGHISIQIAKLEFAEITGQDPDARGCRCCGEPHDFNEKEYPKDSV